MAGTIMPNPKFIGFDNNGDPLSGGKLYTYTAGTTTPQDTYSDVGLTTPNANPVILDSAGRATVFLSNSSYKFVLKDSDDVTIWSQDNITNFNPTNLDIEGIVGVAVAEGEAVYLSDGSGGQTAGKWYKTDGDFDYASSLPTVAIVTLAAAANTSASLRLQGSYTFTSAIVAGQSYYLSATAGALATTPATNSRFFGVGAADGFTVVFSPNPPNVALSPTFGTVTATTAFVLGSPTTNGIRMDLSSGTMEIREGDDSAYGPLNTGALEAKGVLTVTAGAVGAPAITTTGDTNTGVYFPAADTVAVTTSGTERVRVTSAGELVVNNTVGLYTSAGRGNVTINGTNAVLAFGNSASGSGYIYSDASFLEISAAGSRYLMLVTNGVERLRITSGGDLAIGATAKLYLDGTSASGNTYLTESAADTISVFTGGTERVRVTSNGNVGINTSSVVSAASRIGMVLRGNANGAEFIVQSTSASDTTSDGLALIASGVDGYLYNRLNGVLSFATNNTERMRVDSSGNVGIGTSSPVGLLDVASTTPVLTIRNTNGFVTAGSIVGSLNYYTDDLSTIPNRVVASISALAESDYVGVDGASTSLVFRTHPSGAAQVERFRLNSSGVAILGSGEASATPAGNTFRAPNATGTNIAGANLTLAAGNGTGTGGSGYIAFQTAPTSTTGSSANALTERMRVTSGGQALFGTLDSSLYFTNAGSDISTYYRLKYTGGDNATSAGVAFGNDANTGAVGFWINNSASKAVLGARLTAAWDNTVAGSEAAYLDFMTQASGAAAATRLRITSGGNLAIGATAKLYLDGTAATGDTYLVESASNTLDLVAGGTTFRHTTTALGLATNDAASLGVSGTAWSDLFLASGAVINWNAGDTTLTHTAANTLTVSSAATALRYNVYSTSNSGAPKLALMNGLNSCGIGLLGDSSGTMVLFAGDATTERMRITGGGNVGIGVTPSAWSGAVPLALQIGAGTAIGSNTDGTTQYVNSAYYNGTDWKYTQTSYALRYALSASSGEFQWYTAPSGTSGNTVTFTERFRILNGGDIAIGATAKLYLDGVAATGDTYIYESAANSINFYAGGASRLIIDGSYIAQQNASAPGIGFSTAASGTSTGTTVVRNANSVLYLLSSSRRFKENIATADVTDAQLDAFLALTPCWWDYTGQKNGALGFIAEDLAALPLKRYDYSPLCNFDKDGVVESNRDYALIAMQHLLIQRLERKVAALEARLN